VAFLASYNHPGILSPLLAATLGSLTGLWSLFLPSFLWIFTLAPHMEYLSSQPRMNGALTAIGAVVTAVIAYLALWFAENLFFPQGLRLGSLVDIAWRPLILAMISFALLVSRRIGMVPLILLAGGLGVILKVVV
jgi:chromate transporter